MKIKTWWCEVKKTKEVYGAYFDKLVDTVAREKNLSTRQAEILVSHADESDPLNLSLELAYYVESEVD